MNIFERRYKALRILSQLPDAAHGSIMTKLGGGAPYDDPANFDAFADKLADLFDIEEHVSVSRGYVYAGPAEGVVVTPNEGHPTPGPVWFSMRKTPFGWTVLANGSTRLPSREHEVEAFAAACSYFNRDPDDFQVRHKDGNTYYEYEAKR